MKLIKSVKGSAGGIIGTAIAVVMVLVVSVIIGSVENGTVFTQSLSSTIGDYIEPIAMLGALAMAGFLAVKGTR